MRYIMYKNYKRILVTIITVVNIAMGVSYSSYVNAEQVDSFIAGEMESREILGLQLAVVHNGKIAKLTSYGSLDAKRNEQVVNDTIFPINSMTKAFTGTLIVKLASMNKLNLSDQVGIHLENLPEGWQLITIGQILSHTSGLPSILSGNLIELVGDGTDIGAWKEVQTLSMLNQPDDNFSYNQTGYVILGKIIEKHFGESYADTVRALLFNTGMNATAQNSFRSDKISGPAQQYVFANSSFQEIKLDFPTILWPDAGMASSAEDLAKYLIALQNEVYFDSKYLKTLWTPHILKDGSSVGFNEKENGYAAGWQVMTRDKYPAVSASGGNAVTLIVYPEENLAIVVLTNVLGSLPIEFVDHIADFYR